MNQLRRELRRKLFPSECDFEEWFNEVQSVDATAATGIVIRCMILAANNPDWPFWTVLDQCKKSVQAKIQLPDLLRAATPKDELLQAQRGEDGR